jgi:outer membrane protein insertion porin family
VKTSAFRVVLVAVSSVLLLSLYGLRAQESNISAPVFSYEGQTVASVQIAGRPDIDQRSLQSLIEQPSGSAYSQAKVDATVANLKENGRLGDVKVEVIPEATGLRVLFVLQPAFYFGVFQFTEAINRFSYTRLLQATNYERQEPYTKARLEEGESNLLEFFHQTGYFLATVEPELQTDTAHRVVNVIFRIRLKRHARFGAIHLVGASPEETQKLEHSLHTITARIRGAYLKTGGAYSYSKLQKATSYLSGQLGKQHYLAGNVHMLSARYNPETNRADIAFHVQTGPEIAIKITGAHVWGRTQKKLIPIYQENAVDPDLVHEGADNIASYFQSKGFFDVKVTSHIEQPPSGATTVLYQVQKGQRGKVTDVEIQGNRQFSGKKLAPTLAVQKAHRWLPFFSHGKYSSQLVRTSVKRLQAAYRAAGYSEAKVTPQVSRKGGDVQVVFSVEEGVRDIVETLEVQGNKSLLQSQFAPKGLNLEAGKPYSQDLLNQDRDRILATYLDHGFLTAIFRAKVTPMKTSPHHVQVVYMIKEGPQVYASVVIPVGAEHTRADTVKTNADIKAGKPLSETALLQAESQLLGLGVFDWASVDTREPITDQSQTEVLLKVHESKRNTISYGFGFEVTNRGGKIPSGTIALPGLPPVGLPSNFVTSQQTFWGPRGSIEYTRNDLFGRAQAMTLNALAGRLDQRVSGSWLDPSFWNSVWTSTVTISGERSSQNPIFTSEQGQGVVQFQRYMDAKRTKSFIARYSFTRTNLSNLLIPDLVLPQDRNVRLSTFSASYSRDTRDNILDAHKGIYQSIELDLSPSALGSNTNFGRLLGQVAYYKDVFGKSTVWANSIRLGLEQSFAGAHIPLSESFFSGGGSSLRGFPLNGAGPQRSVFVCGNPNDSSTCAKISVPVGGPQLMILNSELRFPLKIMNNLGGVAFYDGGNVFRSIGFGGFGSQYTNSVGFGLRYATPVGPIRVDIGHLINTVPGVKSTQFFITLGQAF